MNPLAIPVPDPGTEHELEWTTTTTVTLRAMFTRQALASALGVPADALTPDMVTVDGRTGLAAFLHAHAATAESVDVETTYEIIEITPELEDPDELGCQHDAECAAWLGEQFEDCGATEADAYAVACALVGTTRELSPIIGFLTCLRTRHQQGAESSPDAAAGGELDA